MLQPRFSSMCGPVWFWDEETLGEFMMACIIMYNIIIEDGPCMSDLNANIEPMVVSQDRT